MVFTKRERNIAIGVAAVLGLWGLDRLVLEPFSIRRDQIASELASTNDDIRKMDKLFAEQRKLHKIWDEMNAGGLRNDRSKAELQAQNALDRWAHDCGVNVSSLKPEHDTSDGKFLQIGFRLTGSGPQASIVRLLWDVETTTMPMRISDLQLSTRKDGVDDVLLTLDVSTLSRLHDSDKQEKTSRPLGATADVR